MPSTQAFPACVRQTWGVRHVLSFLVTFFFARALRRRSGANSEAGRVAAKGRMPGVKKEVTRSAEGGVEALALKNNENYLT
jgi:hypothetical protein